MRDKLDLSPVTEKTAPRDTNQNFIRIMEWAEKVRRELTVLDGGGP